MRTDKLEAIVGTCEAYGAFVEKGYVVAERGSKDVQAFIERVYGTLAELELFFELLYREGVQKQVGDIWEKIQGLRVQVIRALEPDGHENVRGDVVQLRVMFEESGMMEKASVKKVVKELTKGLDADTVGWKWNRAVQAG